MNDDKLKQIQKLLDTTEANVRSARDMLNEILGTSKDTAPMDHKEQASSLAISSEGKIVEGIFDGLEMVAPDGKKYPVPANYASKSKLVEGDTLKLTIAENGSFTFKQINPIERKSLIGTLAYENGDYFVLADGKKYKVLLASVSFYKGKAGDKSAIIVPSNNDSVWAALDSIIHDHDGGAPRIQEPSLSKPSEGQEKPLDRESLDAKKESTPDQETQLPVEEPKEVVTQKVSLSDENAQILENLRQSLSHHEAKIDGTDLQGQTPQTSSRTAAEAPESDKPTENKQDVSEQNQQETAPELEVMPEPQEKPYSVTGEPQIIKHDTYVPDMEEDKLVDQEPETNSMGEELKKDVPGMNATAIEELEI